MADRSEATAGRAGWMLIENDGALFRGPARGVPVEVWNPGSGWTPYAGAERERGVDWGGEVTEAQAWAMMRRLSDRR